MGNISNGKEAELQTALNTLSQKSDVRTKEGKNKKQGRERELAKHWNDPKKGVKMNFFFGDAPLNIIFVTWNDPKKGVKMNLHHFLSLFLRYFPHGNDPKKGVKMNLGLSLRLLV